MPRGKNFGCWKEALPEDSWVCGKLINTEGKTIDSNACVYSSGAEEPLDGVLLVVQNKILKG